MRKRIALVLAVVLGLSITACESKKSGEVVNINSETDNGSAGNNGSSGNNGNSSQEEMLWFPSEAVATLADGTQYKLITASVDDKCIKYRYNLSPDGDEYFDYIYDYANGDLGKITQIKAYSKDDISTAETGFTYDADAGTIDVVTNEEGEIIETQKREYIFDSEGRVTKYTKTSQYEDNAPNINVYDYVYGKDNYTVSHEYNIKSYGNDEIKATVKELFTLSYDGTEMTLETTWFDADGNPGYNEESYIDVNGEEKSGKFLKQVKKFNQFAYCTEVENTFENGTSNYDPWRGVQKTDFDDAGRVLSNQFLSKGEVTSSSKFSYDENGNIVEYSYAKKETAKTDIKWMQIPAKYVKALDLYTGEWCMPIAQIIEEGIPEINTDMYILKNYKKEMIFN